MSKTIVILDGDQTGQELLEETLRVIDPTVTGFPVEFVHFDLSLENRRDTDNQVVYDAAKAMRKHRLALKAATITPEDPDDVGSPNAILRREISAEVILRVGRRIPGVRPVGGIFAPISVVRMAVGGAYGADEGREGDKGSLDEEAYRVERISRRVCRHVANFSFQHARRTGGKVFGGPKYTVSPVYEGMFKEELDRAAAEHPDVRYEPQLIDATFALLLSANGEPLVIPCLNRDGDLLSDLVLRMYGSIAGSESQVISIDENEQIDCIMTEAPHGTAPALEGRNVANPMAMILAAAALFGHMKEQEAKRISRGLYEATLEAVYDGIRTSDLGGSAQTTEFSNEVIRRLKAKLEVWSALS
ncbi:MAG: isocitrate/isopropylmalate family dehydrogenase [Candidatus Promineifilaceae bacterium]|nr:isocitrate/isopropylmalate family dehydrogenase [Candidatus Promineifilaceae bacterium]